MSSSMNAETIEGGVQNERSFDRSADAHEPPIPSDQRRRINWCQLLVYVTCMGVGVIGGPLLQRLYFVHGGSRKWLSSCLQTIGFPFMLFPLAFLYLRSRRMRTSQPFFIKPKLFIAGAVLGLLLGFDNYMYSVGLDYIPVSTSSLLFSTQLAFTAIFAFLIVKQRFTFYSINAVILMTLGAIVLALHTSSDRPPDVSNSRYFMGFFFTLGGAALLGIIFPSVELSYKKAGQIVTYTVVMQFQVAYTLFATIICIVGMAVNNDFEVIPKEAEKFGLGKAKYYVVLVSSALVWQFSFVGTLGVVYRSSSLFAGILGAVLLPFTQVAAIIAFDEKFTGEKGMSLALCLWGFASYFIGEYKKTRKVTTLPVALVQPYADDGNYCHTTQH